MSPRPRNITRNKLPALVDRVIQSRRKSIAIEITRQGEVILRAPIYATEAQIQAFASEKSRWIEEKLIMVRQQYPQTAKHQFAQGERFWFLGQQISLELVDPRSQRAPLTLNQHFRLRKDAIPRAQELFTAWYRTQARTILSERVETHAQANQLAYKQIKITSARTRWGSCSSRGTLSFPWRLVMARPASIDYVVIHELVHTRVRNHGQQFWHKVAALFPDYHTEIDWLNKHSGVLTLD